MKRLYVATSDGVCVVNPETGRASEPALTDETLQCLAASTDAVFVGTFDAGLQRAPTPPADGRAPTPPADGRAPSESSTDGVRPPYLDGFERVDDFQADAVTAVRIDPRDGTVWAGTEPSTVSRSTDGGETWIDASDLTTLESADEWAFPPRPHTHHVRWLEPAPDRSRWYAAIEAGALLRTPDEGATWRDRVPSGPRDTHTITTHPDRPASAWVAAGDGYAETTDGGDSWQYPTDGLDHTYCWSVATPPDDPDTVLVSAAHSARRSHTASQADTYVYRRDRTADRWERLTDRGLPTGEGVTRYVLTRGTEPGELFAVSNRGVFHTTDAGDSWRAVVGDDWPDEFRQSNARGIAVHEFD